MHFIRPPQQHQLQQQHKLRHRQQLPNDHYVDQMQDGHYVEEGHNMNIIMMMTTMRMIMSKKEWIVVVKRIGIEIVDQSMTMIMMVQTIERPWVEIRKWFVLLHLNNKF